MLIVYLNSSIKTTSQVTNILNNDKWIMIVLKGIGDGDFLSLSNTLAT